MQQWDIRFRMKMQNTGWRIQDADVRHRICDADTGCQMSGTGEGLWENLGCEMQDSGCRHRI